MHIFTRKYYGLLLKNGNKIGLCALGKSLAIEKGGENGL